MPAALCCTGQFPAGLSFSHSTEWSITFAKERDLLCKEGMGEEARKQGVTEWENVTQAGEGGSGFVTGEVCTEQGGVVQQSVVTGVSIEQKQRIWRGNGSKTVRRTGKRPGKVKTCRRKTENICNEEEKRSCQNRGHESGL